MHTATKIEKPWTMAKINVQCLYKESTCTKPIFSVFLQYLTIEHAISMQITFLESAYISTSHHMKSTKSRDVFVFLYINKQANL